jgi:peptidyl-tRNA hydrolase, PTH1 family
MKLIAGLGNPGKRYTNTRHNIGFQTVEMLAEKNATKLKKKLFSDARECRFIVSGNKAVIIQPLLFMNLSGVVVARHAGRLKISSEDILIVCDDINLPLGSVRIRPKGSSGGHNGLNSVIKSLNTEQVARLRLGIKTEGNVFDLSRYVLSAFSKQEVPEVRAAIKKAAAACECWVMNGAEKTMRIYNN